VISGQPVTSPFPPIITARRETAKLFPLFFGPQPPFSYVFRPSIFVFLFHARFSDTPSRPDPGIFPSRFILMAGLRFLFPFPHLYEEKQQLCASAFCTLSSMFDAACFPAILPVLLTSHKASSRRDNCWLAPLGRHLAVALSQSYIFPSVIDELPFFPPQKEVHFSVLLSWRSVLPQTEIRSFFPVDSTGSNLRTPPLADLSCPPSLRPLLILIKHSPPPKTDCVHDVARLGHLSRFYPRPLDCAFLEIVALS